jgi:hypothetical protein
MTLQTYAEVPRRIMPCQCLKAGTAGDIFRHTKRTVIDDLPGLRDRNRADLPRFYPKLIV